jgi:signal transduction histidine kinase/CheY-like chemotaxis protein
MPSTLRAKLLTIVASAALAFVVLLVTNRAVANRVDTELSHIEQRLLPRVELGPRLETQLEHLVRAFQDAVAAHDLDALERTRDTEKAFLAQIDAAGDALDPAQAAGLRTAMEDYYASAYDVSRRLVTGDSTDGLEGAIKDMQKKRDRVRGIVETATSLDRQEITAAFGAARAAQDTARRSQLVVSIAAMALVLLFTLWVSRGALQTLAELAAGFHRFGKGDFAPIAIATRDELGIAATQANAMAKSLATLQEQRDRGDWLKAGHAGLNDVLRGELTPDEVADRAAAFVARYLEAPCAAIYVADHTGTLELRGRYGFSDGPKDAPAAAPSFRPGEGLVGEAARSAGTTVIDDPPEGYVRVRSGLGDGPPRAIVLVPLSRGDRTSGVLELAVWKPWTDEHAELVSSIRESVAIAIDVARARTRTRELLERSEEQGRQLRAQEEELRSTNEELRTQQEELQHTNDELTEQARQLELQRQVLEERNAELAAARRGIEAKAEELATVSAYKSQFLANMSHELRTPLNSMLLLSSLLAENDSKNLTPKQVEHAQTIYGAGNDLLSLINQVLDLAKVEAGKQEVHLADVSLRGLADRCERVFGPLARKKGLSFVVTVEDGLPATIETDDQRANQIVNNLAGNAIKFTDRGEVTVRIGRPGPGARPTRRDLVPERTLALSVTDTGPGIAPEHQERIFAPFEQVDGAADRRHGGSGLGLSIARELATLLGGELQIRSAQGKGSTFTLLLPERRRAAAAEPAQATAPDEDYILVIEDDRTLSDVLGAVIRDKGLAYVGATDGTSGLRIARQRRPRGIVLDVRLPDVDGWTVMDRLRDDPALSNVPVHFLSAVDDRGRGLAMGAVGYATKPATRRDLVAIVEALVERRPRQPAPRRVLVVEPDATRGAALLEHLTREGLSGERVENGGAALAAVEADPAAFGCVVLDVALPDMTAIELVDRIARGSNGHAPETRPTLVVYTAREVGKADAKELEARGVTVVLEGQSSHERLLAEIGLFVRRVQEGLAPRREAPAPVGAGVRLEGAKVLLADDDMRTVYALSATLRAKGVTVLVADTGAAALATLEAHPEVDAVLMDIMMPEMDGYEATRRIRAQARFGALPIIALTAKAMKGDRERCLEAGASDYLPKPIDADRLLRMLHALVRSSRPADARGDGA